MKKTTLIVALVSFCFILQSCGADEKETPNTSGTDSRDQVITDADSDQEMPKETSNKLAETADYHITLNKGGEDVSTGMSKGKAMISDNWICTIGDWKMRILVDEFNPEGMVGNEYHAHIISQDFNSTNCKCLMENMTGTGITNSTGERVKMEGSISCDDGESTGTFAVQLIQPGK